MAVARHDHVRPAWLLRFFQELVAVLVGNERVIAGGHEGVETGVIADFAVDAFGQKFDGVQIGGRIPFDREVRARDRGAAGFKIGKRRRRWPTGAVGNHAGGSWSAGTQPDRTQNRR